MLLFFPALYKILLLYVNPSLLFIDLSSEMWPVCLEKGTSDAVQIHDATKLKTVFMLLTLPFLFLIIQLILWPTKNKKTVHHKLP